VYRHLVRSRGPELRRQVADDYLLPSPFTSSEEWSDVHPAYRARRRRSRDRRSVVCGGGARQSV